MHETTEPPSPIPRDPVLIQGGMGVGVSNWRLARATALAGQRLNVPVLGVVSGTGLSVILVDRLQAGDEDVVRALKAFPPDIARKITDEYLREGTPAAPGRGKLPPKPEVMVTGTVAIRAKMIRLAVASAFVEIWLAKEGHAGPIGINVLEKVQLMHLPVLLGAMMAGVDYVLVGAGIPYQIPAVLDSYACNRVANYRMDVAGSAEKHVLTLDPRSFVPDGQHLKRPKFLLIASHHALAMRLNSTIEVDGFVMEGPDAGGHNAPARGKTLADDGQPIYGDRDKPDLSKLVALGKPFWLAGAQASHESLQTAQQLGATGIQVGSAFALSDESGLQNDGKAELRAHVADHTLGVKTSAIASPSGFPFQVAQLEGTLSEDPIYESRERICNIGHLVEAYQKDESEGGGIGFRCPAEPIEAFVKKGGSREDTEGRLCLCNGLGSAAGHPRQTKAGPEPAVFTLGKDLSFYDRITTRADGRYSADDVVCSILGLPQLEPVALAPSHSGSPNLGS